MDNTFVGLRVSADQHCLRQPMARRALSSWNQDETATPVSAPCIVAYRRSVRLNACKSSPDFD